METTQQIALIIALIFFPIYFFILQFIPRFERVPRGNDGIYIKNGVITEKLNTSSGYRLIYSKYIKGGAEIVHWPKERSDEFYKNFQPQVSA